jgi:phosphoribosyl-ATP pyrophosphohydrolase/phosphoribosyl-AMP cyclohydrolase
MRKINKQKEKEVDFINTLKFDDRGLIPAIVQDFHTKKVLMLAYMNKESIEISLKEKKTCFYSRSRNELWRKGESSGNFQQIVSIDADCDGDTLLIEVIKNGPACHTGADSCFFEHIFSDDEVSKFSMLALYEMMEGRKNQPKEGSYTTYLFEKGMEQIRKKIGEECTETVIAGAKNDRQEAIFEIADLTYHILVMMVEMGISIQDIKTELSKRHIIDSKVKQEPMK